VIYLIFNEGYSATAGDEWHRPALCEASKTSWHGRQADAITRWEMARLQIFIRDGISHKRITAFYPQLS
jgi:hypothetical protein